MPFLLFNFSLQFQKKAKHKQAGRGRDLVTATVAVTGLNKRLLMFPTARWKAHDIRSAVAAAVCFFLRKIKKIHFAQRAHARNCLHRLVSLAAAGLNKRLLMLPTARWKAHDLRSAVAAAATFFLRKTINGSH